MIIFYAKSRKTGQFVKADAEWRGENAEFGSSNSSYRKTVNS